MILERKVESETIRIETHAKALKALMPLVQISNCTQKTKVSKARVHSSINRVYTSIYS